MCQFDLSPPNKNFSCGRVGFTEWTLQQRDPYIFTVVYNYSSPINYSRYKMHTQQNFEVTDVSLYKVT